jgi:hypothetical protein
LRNNTGTYITIKTQDISSYGNVSPPVPFVIPPLNSVVLVWTDVGSQRYILY